MVRDFFGFVTEFSNSKQYLKSKGKTVCHCDLRLLGKRSGVLYELLVFHMSFVQSIGVEKTAVCLGGT